MGPPHWQREDHKKKLRLPFIYEVCCNRTLGLDGVRISHSLVCGEHLSLLIYVGKGSMSTGCRLLRCFTGVFKVTAPDTSPAAKRFFCFRKQNIV